MTLLTRIIQALGPAIPSGSLKEGLRAGVGALLGLIVAGVIVLASSGEVHLGLFLIAPFGASAVLIFAVPASPLAQPWSAVIGNTVSALVAIATCAVLSDPSLRIPVAVGMAIAVMIMLRALHPPGGAVAMTVAMSPDLAQQSGLWFALSPVALGTAILVVAGVLYGRATGRHYPFRQFAAEGPHQTADRAPFERLGLSENDLTAILSRYRQSLNLGVEDLSRLIAAAEIMAAGRRAHGATAADIMSRDLVTVRATTSVNQLTDLFLRHGFTSLPVVTDEDRYLGLVYQRHVLGKTGSHDPASPGHAARASDIMARTIPTAAPSTRLSALLINMASGRCDAMPVLSGERLVGIVTQTDMIAALARATLSDPRKS
ncbi:HPP family protein [Paracoccus nototheniae]|uniref:HPP family protein n=1 Tax=Paracoccus nototheniae TaxID=2489002 RepID=A0ABW4DW36_9RHOB|nr:HPP family protein [Paracoccus nototheniae]